MYDENGRELFKPKINRSPQFERGRQGMAISDYLYAARHQAADIRARLEREEDMRAMRWHSTKVGFRMRMRFDVLAMHKVPLH